MIVVDTTVLVYAVGGEHPLREPSARLVDAVGDGRVTATTTVEVVQEFVHVRSRTHDRANAVALGRRWAALLSPLLQPSERDLELGLSFFGQGDVGAFDAILAATALGHGAEALVSADRAFAKIPGLVHVSPGAPEFTDLLGP